MSGSDAARGPVVHMATSGVREATAVRCAILHRLLLGLAPRRADSSQSSDAGAHFGAIWGTRRRREKATARDGASPPGCFPRVASRESRAASPRPPPTAPDRPDRPRPPPTAPDRPRPPRPPRAAAIGRCPGDAFTPARARDQALQRAAPKDVDGDRSHPVDYELDADHAAEQAHHPRGQLHARLAEAPQHPWRQHQHQRCRPDHQHDGREQRGDAAGGVALAHEHHHRADGAGAADQRHAERHHRRVTAGPGAHRRAVAAGGHHRAVLVAGEHLHGHDEERMPPAMRKASM